MTSSSGDRTYREFQEWWIYPRKREIGDPDWDAAFPYKDALWYDNGEQIHVIEKDALTACQAELAEATYNAEAATKMVKITKAENARLKEQLELARNMIIDFETRFKSPDVIEWAKNYLFKLSTYSSSEHSEFGTSEGEENG